MVKAKLSPEMFFDPDVADVFRFAIEQHEKHGKYPSEVFIKQNFPTFPKFKVTDPVGMLVDAFKEWRKHQLAKQVLTTATDNYAKGDVETALSEMEKGLSQIAAESITDEGDIHLTVDVMERYDAYQEFSKRPEGLLGFPTGYPALDDVLSGMQPGQLVTVVALPKVGKSTLAMQMQINAHDAGARCMFQTIEMSSLEMTQRYECQRAGISYSRFRTGTLRNSELKRYLKMLKRTEKMDNPFIVTDKVLNLSHVTAKIEEHKPDVVVVDGVYLLNSHPDFVPGSPQALTYLSRSFKKLAQTTGCTVILTTQALQQKLQGGKLSAHSIGYSSSFFQDSDLVIGLEKNEAGDEDVRELTILGSRHSGGANVTLDWDWESSNFTEMGSQDE